MDKYAPDTSPVTDVVSALLNLAGEISHFKDFLGARVAEMRAEEWRFVDDRGGEQLRAEIALYERALDRTARVLVDLAKLGLEERRVQLDERTGALLAGVVARTSAGLQAEAIELIGRVAEVEGVDARQAAALARALQQQWPGWLGVIAPRELLAAGAEDKARG